MLAKIVLIFWFKFSLINGKYLYQYAAGYNRIWTDSMYMNLSPKAGTTATVCVDVREKMAIHLLSKEEKILYEVYPWNDGTVSEDICYTFAWKDDGMAIFKNGEFFTWAFDEDLLQTHEIQVNASGAVRMNTYENYPTWALSEKSVWDASVFPVQLETPLVLNLKRKIKVDDYIVVVGKKYTNTTMEIKMTGTNSIYIPISFKLTTDESKHDVTMSSFLDDKLHSEHRFTDTRTYEVRSKLETYIITFVCGKLGWRIYLNGLDIFFYYHQLPFNEVNKIKLSGVDGEWSLVKLVQ